jgi:SAM-dependent methyltransferase
MPAKDATQRFSSRVEKYVRYRPGYPPQVLDLLKAQCGLTPAWLVADIGSGTGLLTRIFLENGNRVFGVEPNADMRRAGEEFLGENANFVSVDGTAEATSLAAHSVDLVTAGQAAHWFDQQKARPEVARILKPEGWLALVWNERLMNTPFLRDYEQLLLAYGTDYQDVRHEQTMAELGPFFAPSPFRESKFPTLQQFDYDGLEGRLLSSSYAPGPEHATFAPMLRELRRLFDAHAVNKRVAFAYSTRVFYGQPQRLM